MSFIETPRFPDCVSLGAEGGPGFMTDVIQVNSGDEYRNQVREQALHTWEVAHAARRPEEYKLLRAFFLLAAGRFNAFRFKDWTDFQVLAGEGVWVLVSGSTYQMYKRYELGVLTYLRKITKPVSGTVTVTPAVDTGTVNYTTGQITGGVVTPTSWVGEFDVPCRFGTDKMEAETITKNRDGDLIIGWRSIPIVEVRV